MESWGIEAEPSVERELRLTAAEELQRKNNMAREEQLDKAFSGICKGSALHYYAEACCSWQHHGQVTLPMSVDSDDEDSSSLKPNKALLKKACEALAKYAEENKVMMDDLNNCMEQLYKENTPSASTHDRNADVMKRLEDEARTVNKWNLSAYGGSANGFGLKDSDLDLSACAAFHARGGYQGEEMEFKKLVEHLQDKDVMERLSIVEASADAMSAMIPVFKMKIAHGDEIVEVDLSFNNKQAKANTYMLKMYSSQDERLPQLVMVIKKWIQKNGLHGADNGGFNTYTIILLCIFYLKMGVEPAVLRNPNVMDGQQSKDRPQHNLSVAELTLGFMAFYAQFDFSEWVIDTRLDVMYNRYYNTSYAGGSMPILMKCVSGGRPPARAFDVKKTGMFDAFLGCMNRFNKNVWNKKRFTGTR